MKRQNKKIIAIIPAFNEEKTVTKVVREVKKYVPDILVIDDSSRDRTAQKARKAGAKVISHILNQGVGITQKTGYNIAFKRDYDYIVQLDADEQHNPEYIPELIDFAISGNYDMVIGSRFLNSSYKNLPLGRKLGIKFFSVIANVLGRTRVTDITSGYRVYKVKSLKKLTPITDKNWAIEQTIEAGIKGLKIGEYSVKMPMRETGESQFVNLGTVFRYPFRMLEASLRVMVFRR
ncbi:MAG TPA: glycosyltransferase family 2 protein [Patescibacteria group bacterium]|nr:glycosyltransferase family 2 protein [Patescibacteria group bacterium]